MDGPWKRLLLLNYMVRVEWFSISSLDPFHDTDPRSRLSPKKKKGHSVSRSHRGKYPVDHRSLEANRLTSFANEPLEQGNRLVAIPDASSDIAATEELHRQQMAQELQSIEVRLT